MRTQTGIAKNMHIIIPHMSIFIIMLMLKTALLI